jgi:hypothetical protein
MRFGFGPLYVRYVDIFDAVAVLEEILKTEWKMCRAGGRRSRLTKQTGLPSTCPDFASAQSGLRCPQHSPEDAMSSLASKQARAIATPPARKSLRDDRRRESSPRSSARRSPASTLGPTLLQPQMDEIHRALAENLVIFFRDQDISAQQHLAFGRKFGELHIHPAAPHEEGEPALMKIYADKNSPRANGEGWHTDVSCDEERRWGRSSTSSSARRAAAIRCSPTCTRPTNRSRIA